MALAATLAATMMEPASARPSDPARASAVATTVPMRVLTYNIQAKSSLSTFDAAVRAVLPYADIVALQEINTKDKGARIERLRASGWDSWREVRTGYFLDPTRGSATQTPVLWRADRFELLSAQPVRISAPANLHGELPKGQGIGRWVSVVRLKDKLTGQPLAIVNTHLIQGAVQGGRKVKRHPKTFRLYRSQVIAVANLAAKERARGQQVYLVGDFNSDYVSDAKRSKVALPVRRFRSVGFTSMWAYSRPKMGTRGRAFLDHVFTWQRPSSTAVLRGVRLSDHFPAVGTYTIPKLPGY